LVFIKEQIKKKKFNQGIYIIDIIKSIKKDNSNYINNFEQILNSINNGNEILNILINDCSFLKINPETLKIDDKVQKLLFDVSRDKLINDLIQKLNVIFNQVSNNINEKTPKQLREFNSDNYYNEKISEFNELFNNVCKEDFHQFQNYLRTNTRCKKTINFFF
jgi:DNA mismatch repair ATPase MutS